MSLVVAIDGPAGAGKSSIARAVAARCELSLLDTGAIYRSLALAAKIADVDWDDADGLGKLAARMQLRFERDGDREVVLLDDEDVTRDIRRVDISSGASRVSRHGPVRDALLETQRSLGRVGGGSVLEGRDIGTVVFPDAEVKVFLTASVEERARRRAMELEEKGEAIPFDAVLEAIRERDRADSERPVAPLKQADDATRIDSSLLAAQEVVDEIVELVEAARGERVS